MFGAWSIALLFVAISGIAAGALFHARRRRSAHSERTHRRSAEHKNTQPPRAKRQRSTTEHLAPPRARARTNSSEHSKNNLHGPPPSLQTVDHVFEIEGNLQGHKESETEESRDAKASTSSLDLKPPLQVLAGGKDALPEVTRAQHTDRLPLGRIAAAEHHLRLSEDDIASILSDAVVQDPPLEVAEEPDSPNPVKEVEVPEGFVAANGAGEDLSALVLCDPSRLPDAQIESEDGTDPTEGALRPHKEDEVFLGELPPEGVPAAKGLTDAEVLPELSLLNADCDDSDEGLIPASSGHESDIGESLSGLSANVAHSDLDASSTCPPPHRSKPIDQAKDDTDLLSDRPRPHRWKEESLRELAPESLSAEFEDVTQHADAEVLPNLTLPNAECDNGDESPARISIENANDASGSLHIPPTNSDSNGGAQSANESSKGELGAAEICNGEAAVLQPMPMETEPTESEAENTAELEAPVPSDRRQRVRKYRPSIRTPQAASVPAATPKSVSAP